MMNKKLQEGLLLDKNGNLNEAGYATSLIKDYNRKQIKGLKTRIKEWDYYAFLNNDYGVCLTLADNSYMSLASISFLDFKNKQYITKSSMRFFTFGKLKLPSSSKSGDIVYHDKKVSISFLNDGQKRILKAYYKKFKDNEDLSLELEVINTSDNSMVIAIPFKKKKHFYYNQKVNLLKANGYFTIGNQKYEVKNNLGVLDWGRGVWTYNNTWYWASLSYQDEEGYKGFNLGYGFGDTSSASENMVFFNDKVFKMDDVVFNINKKNNKDDYMSEWTVKSKNEDINLTFKPIIDRYDNTDLKLLCSTQHQVFGYFNGYIKKDQTIIKINNALGFAEKVHNKW